MKEIEAAGIDFYVSRSLAQFLQSRVFLYLLLARGGDKKVLHDITMRKKKEKIRGVERQVHGRQRTLEDYIFNFSFHDRV